MAIRIERLQPGEGERWRRIRLQALAEAPYAFGTTLAQAAAWTLERWEAQLLEFATFVALAGGVDVGVARGARHARSDTRELISMWVAPSVRRQGVAVQLIDHVARWAAAEDARWLMLDVLENNASALLLYESRGFQRSEDQAFGACDPGELRLVRPTA